MKIFGFAGFLLFWGDMLPDTTCEKSFAAQKEEWQAEKEILLARLQEAEQRCGILEKSGNEINGRTCDWALVESLMTEEKQILSLTVEQKQKITSHVTSMLNDVEGTVLYSGSWVQIPRSFVGRLTLDLRAISRIFQLAHVHLFWRLPTNRHLEVVWKSTNELTTKCLTISSDFFMRTKAVISPILMTCAYQAYEKFESFLGASAPSWKQKRTQEGVRLAKEWLMKTVDISGLSIALKKLNFAIFPNIQHVRTLLEKSVADGFSGVRTLAIRLSPGLLGSDVLLDSGSMELVALCSLFLLFGWTISEYILGVFIILWHCQGCILRILCRGFRKLYLACWAMILFIARTTISPALIGVHILLFLFSLARAMIFLFCRGEVDECLKQIPRAEVETKEDQVKRKAEKNDEKSGVRFSDDTKMSSIQNLSMAPRKGISGSYSMATVAKIIAAFENERRMQRWGTYRGRSKEKCRKNKKPWTP